MIQKRVVEALERIRQDINAEYGFMENMPRINLGPCGRFARLFYGIWNSRCEEKVIICFFIPPGDGTCEHVFIKLPDGNYFDGGFGVMKVSEAMSAIPPGSEIREMIEYDEGELEKYACGLNREYPNCPTYSDERVRAIIESHLTF
jgi:hypothetical protein